MIDYYNDEIIDTCEKIDDINSEDKLEDELDELKELDQLDEEDELFLESEYIRKKNIYYEPEYEYIRESRNDIWMKYDHRIQKTLKIMAYWKNFDRDELYQQAFLYYVYLCKIYTPYYQGNFIPFDKFLFKNLITKLRAYIQNYYIKRKKEQPTELSERTTTNVSGKNEINAIEDELLIKHLLSKVNDRQAEILDLTFKGYKQQEIGNMLDISQSRVSVIKKRTLSKLKTHLLENENFDDM